MRDPSVAPGNLQPGAKTTFVFLFFPYLFLTATFMVSKVVEGWGRRALIAI